MREPYEKRHRIVALMRQGWTDARIVRALLDEKERTGTLSAWQAERVNLVQQVRCARDVHDFEAEGGPIRRKGPWPVSYVRSTGEVVYRVGAGHDVPEGSLRALGFEP